MNTELLDYYDFVKESYEECKNAEWFPDVLEACYDLDTDDLTVSGIIGEIHEGLRVNYTEALKYFWTIMLINPLIAIKAYQETDLLIGKIDFYATFKHINQTDSWYRSNIIYNPSVEYFMIFAIEALLQKDMNPEMLDTVNSKYLKGLYDHDREIMQHKNHFRVEGVEAPAKWINHRNLKHILNAIDPHHIIILLEYFADRYGARLRRGRVGEYCYSGDKYNYIIQFIKNKYGSLSEYIDWSPSYQYHYRRYYERSLYHDEMFKNMDVIFPTEEDKMRIQEISGIRISDPNYRRKRIENRKK